MNTHPRWSTLGSAAVLLILLFSGTSAAVADEGDPPSRVARLAYVEGSVSLQPGGTDEWVEAPLNRPLTTGDAVWSDVNSRVELQLDGSLVRLSSRTSIAFLNVADHVTQIQLSAGTVIVRVRRLDDDETYEIDTPNLALSVQRPGLYRISVDDTGMATTVAVRSGQAQVTGGGADFPVTEGQQVAFTGMDTLNAGAQPYAASPFDAWSANRDGRWDHSVAARYVSDDVVGYTDLDDQGDWNSTPLYGNVWFPRHVQPGWAPYHYGHWAYIAPWGYTWVDDQPWGFAPFHYGRWIAVNGAWGWVPCPPRQRGGEAYVRPVYAPALVAWVGGGAGVAWFALGPREVYVPSYPVSRGYVNNINISNTIVNRTVVNNIYETTVINNRSRNVNVTNITYMNRGVHGAIAATTTQAFTSAQPVSSHTVQFDPRAGRVEAFAPAAVPTRLAVLGLGRQGAPRPPTALQARTVVARTAPPPPPPTFERRQQAIQQNGGRPLSMAAMRQIQPQANQRPASIRIAPQVAQGNNRPGGDFNSRRNAGPPPAQQAIERAAPGVPSPRPPDAGNAALQRQHLQDQQQQQQQRQQQDQDTRRQQLQLQSQQQQQSAQQKQRAEPEHGHPQQQLDPQRQLQQQQQLEQQHQQQAQVLQQQHAQEQLQHQQQQQQQQQQAQVLQQQRAQEQLQRQQQQQHQVEQQQQQQQAQVLQQQRAQEQLQRQQQQQQLEQQHQQQAQALQQQRAQEQLQHQQQQQQLEQQHQQQAQALQQQHAQEQLQHQQQQQKPQQDNQVREPVRHEDKAPKPKNPNDPDH